MPQKGGENTTTLHETLIQLVGFQKRIVCHFDADERDRLITVLEGERDEPLRFYGFELVEGLECYVNLSQITKINVLDYLPGLPFAKPPEKTEEEWEKHIEERDASDDPVILRVWSAANQNTEVFHDVDHSEWRMIQAALEEGDQQFIGFTDEDGERVILSIAQLAAIEMFDTHYLAEDDLARLLKEGEDQVA